MLLRAAQLLVLGVTPSPFRTLSASKHHRLLYRAAGRAGGDARVQLLSPLMRPPVGFTGQRAHQLPSLAGGLRISGHHVAQQHAPARLLLQKQAAGLARNMAWPTTGCRYKWAGLSLHNHHTAHHLIRQFLQLWAEGPARHSLQPPADRVTQTAAHTGTGSRATLWPAAKQSCWLGLSGSPACTACRRQVLQAGSRGGPRRFHADFQI